MDIFKSALKWLGNKENDKKFNMLKKDESLIAAYMDGFFAAQELHCTRIAELEAQVKRLLEAVPSAGECHWCKMAADPNNHSVTICPFHPSAGEVTK